jgi:phosphatidylglycerophosphatase C
MKKTIIAAFDFDHTLITRNSLPDFLMRYDPKAFIHVACAVPMLLAFATGRISNSEAKERLLRRFLGGMPEAEFRRRCIAYADRLDVVADNKALARVRWHQSRGHEVVIVSAGIEDWIRPWAKRHGIGQVLATRIVRQNGMITGKLDGANCHGQEKANRLLAAYPNRDTYELYAYGDGPSDAEMFTLADHVFKRRFS